MSESGQAVTRAEFLKKAADLLVLEDYTGAMELAEQRLADRLDGPEAITVLAAVSFKTGALGHAINLMRDLSTRSDAPADSHEILAILYCLAGDLQAALYHGKETTITPCNHELIPLFGAGFPPFTDALATVSHKPLMRKGAEALKNGDLANALFLLEQHLLIDSRDVEAIDHYAQALMADGQVEQALGMLRTLVTLGGMKPTLMSRIARCLMLRGEHEAGMAAHRAAMDAAPNSAAIWGAMAADLAYFPAHRGDARELAERWAEMLATFTTKSNRPRPRLASAEQLTIGYLMGGDEDPRIAYMLSRIIAAHDRKRFTIVGLGRGDLSEPRNALMRGLCDRWRNIAALDVLTLGALIRGEGISVLIDAEGLAAPERASLFLREIAPIQAAWLNAPAFGSVPGAGIHLTSADQGQAGAVVLPAGRMLMGDEVCNAGPTPFPNAGCLTFGVDVRKANLTSDAARLWARILHEIPNSMLALRDADGMSEPEYVNKIVELFGNYGAAHRIDVIQSDLEPFLQQVDVMLFSHPNIDVPTAGQILRSGVPCAVLTASQSGQDAAAVLRSIGLGDELAAESEDEFFARICALAANPDRIVALRAQLPELTAASAAYDPVRFTRALEEALTAKAAELIG